jgi:hypothetical protein
MSGDAQAFSVLQRLLEPRGVLSVLRLICDADRHSNGTLLDDPGCGLCVDNSMPKGTQQKIVAGTVIMAAWGAALFTTLALTLVFNR